MVGDLVLKFVERVADGEFGGDFGDGYPVALLPERKNAKPGVDLDDDELFRFRVDGELYVAAAGEVAQRPHRLDSFVAHLLVGGVSERVIAGATVMLSPGGCPWGRGFRPYR